MPPNVYQHLYRHFGPQGWWPILERIRGEWVSVYKVRKRLTADQMFEIAVGAILTQNTAWPNVVKALASLKTAGLLTPRRLKTVSARKLRQLIRPSGYYNQKAKKLKAFSGWLVKNYAGDLRWFFKKPLNEARLELLRLHGLGPETADSILLYAGRKPVFVIDTYTRRLLDCYGIRFKTYDEYRLWFEKRLPKNPRLFGEFHALIVAWAKLRRIDPVLAKKVLILQLRKKRVK